MIADQLGELQDEANMLYKLSCIASCLLLDELYTKEDAANALIEFMNSRLISMDSLSTKK